MIHVINWFVNILTLGLVSIATITTTTYHVDEPIEELNNLTLNEVFDDGNLIINGDFSNGTTSWINSSGTLTVDNGIAQFLATARYGYSYQKFTTIGNHSYYYSIDFNISNYNQVGNYRLNSITYPIYFNNFGYSLDVWNTHSFIATETNTSTNSIFTMRDYNTSNFEPMFYDNVYVIDLTDLGIDNLTKQEIDDWYDIYVQAIANNGVYIETTSHLNNNIHLVDVSVMVISFGLWVWLFKFLKGVIF